MSDLSLLMDMGFPKEKAESALSVTGNSGVEPAMEWLLAHAESMDTSQESSAMNAKDTSQESSAMNAKDTSQESSEMNAKDTSIENTEEVMHIEKLSEDMAAQAMSMKCDECNRIFRTDSEVQYHTLKSGHQSFSVKEHNPRIEEKAFLLALNEEIENARLENFIKQRIIKEAEEIKKEELEREKNRRKTGQEITHVRQKIQEEETKRLAELKRTEKLEAKVDRQKILEQLEKSILAWRENFGMGSAPVPANSDHVVIVGTPAPEQASTADVVYDKCRLQIYLMNGDCLTHTFGANEELSAVMLYIELNRTDSTPFSLMTTFPKKVFTEEDMGAPLSALGLVPSAVLIVCKAQ